MEGEIVGWEDNGNLVRTIETRCDSTRLKIGKQRSKGAEQESIYLRCTAAKAEPYVQPIQIDPHCHTSYPINSCSSKVEHRDNS